MSKFTDLDSDRKRQFLLNVRVQSLAVQYIAHHENTTFENIVEILRKKAVEDVFCLSESEIDEQIDKFDAALEYCIKHETTMIVKSALN